MLFIKDAVFNTKYHLQFPQDFNFKRFPSSELKVVPKGENVPLQKDDTVVDGFRQYFVRSDSEDKHVKPPAPKKQQNAPNQQFCILSGLEAE